MINHTATISPDANIDPSAQIGAFSTIDSGVTIAKDVIIDAHVHIKSGVTLGHGVHLFSHVNIGNGKVPISIGKHSHIREFVHIGTDENDIKPIQIGQSCYILGYSTISDDIIIEDRCVLSNNAEIESGVRLQKGAIIGAKSSVAKNCIIGQGSMIGGVTDVTSNIPPYCMAEGKPDAQIRGLNIVGIKRNIECKQSARAIKRAYMSLKKEGFTKQDATKLLPTVEDEYAKIFVQFIANH